MDYPFLKNVSHLYDTRIYLPLRAMHVVLIFVDPSQFILIRHFPVGTNPRAQDEALAQNLGDCVSPKCRHSQERLQQLTDPSCLLSAAAASNPDKRRRRQM
jgi:hypothetical protein